MIRDLTPEDYDELVAALSDCRQTTPLTEDQNRALAQRARIREVLRGTIVMKQGAEPDYIYFVITGQLRSADTESDPPRLLNYHAARTFVGEQGLLYGKPRAATVDVISDAKLAFWDQTTFDWLLAQNDRARPYFEKLYQGRVRRARRPFPGKQWDEVTLFRSGKHPLMLINALLGPILLLFIGLVLLVFLLAFPLFPPTWIGGAVGVLVFVSLLWGVFNFIDWRDDEYIVTSKRVIHIERYVIYGEKRDEAPLIRIQDVTVVATNIWERLLNYNDVIIQTAGAGTIVFTGVADAEEAKEIMFEERAKAIERREAGDVAHIRKILGDKMQRPVDDVDVPVDILTPTTGIFEERKGLRLPPFLDYLWPRMSVVKGDTVTWRKHWFIWLMKTWPASLSLLILLVLIVGSLVRLPPVDALGPNAWVFTLFLALGAFLTFIWYIFRYDDWHRDVYIVTNDRIIDVDSSAFRLRGEERREGTFDVVQNITYVIPSFFHSLLNMGNVTIETAGTIATFTFDDVFDPSSVQQEIFNRMVAFQEEQRRKDRVREDTRRATWFGEYHHLHKEDDHPSQA